jgi:hypothetical protein
MLILHPSRVLCGQYRCPQAWPLESWTRHSRDSAYCIASSMCLSGCRGLLIQPILGNLLTTVNRGLQIGSGMSPRILPGQTKTPSDLVEVEGR